MLNALCDDITHQGDFTRLVQFLSWCDFSITEAGKPDFTGITKAILLVEQSFSDFGDLDLLILLEHGSRKQAVLIEAKVATANRPRQDGCLAREWKKLLKYLAKRKEGTSSLFVQLYRKQRLVDYLTMGKSSSNADAISGRYKLGKNSVVARAAEELKLYLDTHWLIALVPDSVQEIDKFAKQGVLSRQPEQYDLPSWRMSEIGFLSWHTVKAESENWPQLSRAFDWNESQVFGTTKRHLKTL